MSIAAAERAVQVRAKERFRAKEQIGRLNLAAASLSHVVGNDVPASAVELDEGDASIDNELATARDVSEKVTLADARIGALRNELAAAKKARTQFVLILIGAAVVGLLILSQVFK